MDTEKIKQMGRDYFAANPPNPKANSAFWCAWESHIMETDGRGNEKGQQWREWVKAWREGYSDAASTEGRAIELLGRIFEWHMKDTRPPAVSEWDSSHHVWEDLAEFLDEVKSKPNA